MLDALKSLQQAEVEQAKQPLPGHVSAKVMLFNAANTPAISTMQTQLINDFYKEVIDYYNLQGEFNEMV